MVLVAATPATLTPVHRTLRAPLTGITPRPLRLVGNGLGWFTNLIIVASVLFFVGLALGPHLFGYRTETMLTGSMSPGINPGDVVVATKIPVERLKVGEVISYRIPVEDNRVVSHRVMAISRTPDGTTTVRTKGDANDAIDPWTATLVGRQVYQVHLVVPWIGRAIQWLRTPDLSRVLRYGAPVLLIIFAMIGIWYTPSMRNRGLDPHRFPVRQFPGSRARRHDDHDEPEYDHQHGPHEHRHEHDGSRWLRTHSRRGQAPRAAASPSVELLTDELLAGHR